MEKTLLNKRKIYSSNFQESLYHSRELVNKVIDILNDPIEFTDVFVQDQFDTIPFVGNENQIKRFSDLAVIDLKNPGKISFIEVKDFGALILHDITGLPKKYVDNTLKPLGFSSVYLVFCENNETIQSRIKKKKQLFFVSKENDPIPYGQKLDFLMNRCVEGLDIKCKLSGKYFDCDQYLWKLNDMEPIKEIFKKNFGAKYGNS